MSLEEDLFKAVEANPSDNEAKSVYADYLEEQGNYDLAFALRWCGKRNKHPSFLYKRPRWVRATHRHKSLGKAPDQIPQMIFNVMKGPTQRGRLYRWKGFVGRLYYIRCKDLRDAFGRLAAAFRKLKDEIDL